MRKFNIFLFSLFLVLALAACQDNDATEEPAENDAEETTEESTITINHELGETTVEKNPENVVVFDFGTLDTLDYLGIEVAALPQMNVPSYLSKYESDDYENVGSLKEPDFEKINELEPGLIIISGRQADLYDEFSEIAPTIFVGLDYDDYIGSFKNNVETIGEIFSKEDEVAEVLQEIDDQIAAVQEKTEDLDKEALVVLANDNEISAYGKNSRFGIIHDVFGLKPVDEDIEVSTHGMSVTFEYVAEKNPDIMYVIDRSQAIGEGASAKNVIENDLVAKTEAMKNDDIYYLDPEIWYLSGGGIVSVQEMINEIDSSLE